MNQKLYLFVAVLLAITSIHCKWPVTAQEALRDPERKQVEVKPSPDSGVSRNHPVFTEVSFSDRLQGWAIEKTAIYKSVDGGQSWVKVFTAQPTEKTADTPEFVRIQALSPTSIFVLDSSNGLFRFSGSKMNRIYGMRRHLIRSFRFIDKNSGWAVGQSQTFPNGHWSAEASFTRDGGRTWHEISVAEASNCDCAFYDVEISKSGAILVGDIIANVDSQGHLIRLNEEVRSQLYGRPIIARKEDAIVWILTNQGNRALLSQDSGVTWRVVEVTPARSLDDLYFLTRDQAFALENGVLWKSTDGGLTWVSSSRVSESSTSFVRLPNSAGLFVYGNSTERIF